MTAFPMAEQLDAERSERLRNKPGMVTELILVRHGRTEHNVRRVLQGWTDTPLDELGERQAERAATRIARDFPPDAIVASPLQRALKTATAIGNRVGLTPVIEPGLREMCFGIHEGKTVLEVSHEDPGLLTRLDDHANLEIGWPGGELRREFLQRIWTSFENIIETYPGQRVVVVSHGGVVGAFLALLRGQSPFDPAIYNIANCSLTHLNVVETHSDIHRTNDIAHLADLDEIIDLGRDNA